MRNFSADLLLKSDWSVGWERYEGRERRNIMNTISRYIIVHTVLGHLASNLSGFPVSQAVQYGMSKHNAKTNATGLIWLFLKKIHHSQLLVVTTIMAKNFWTVSHKWCLNLPSLFRERFYSFQWLPQLSSQLSFRHRSTAEEQIV